MEPITIQPGTRYGRLIFVGTIPAQPGFEDGGFHCICASCDSDVFRTSLFTVPGDSTNEWQACDACANKLRFRRSFSYTLRRWSKSMSEGKSQAASRQLAILLRRYGIMPRRLFVSSPISTNLIRRRGYTVSEITRRLRPQQVVPNGTT